MQKAIIIGATSGIGKGLAQLLVENGYKVGIAGRRTGLLEALKSENPASYVMKTFDMTVAHADVVRKLEELTAELGGLDLLIISAGIGDFNDKLDFEIEQRTINTNVVGFTGVADWAFNYFVKKGAGHLVAITSIGGLAEAGRRLHTMHPKPIS
jgi:short-subunit dehydrogenase